jgi:hypothetical protein
MATFGSHMELLCLSPSFSNGYSKEPFAKQFKAPGAGVPNLAGIRISWKAFEKYCFPAPQGIRVGLKSGAKFGVHLRFLSLGVDIQGRIFPCCGGHPV